MKIQSRGTAILVTDHNVKNLFDITDRSYVLGEQTVIAEGTSRELLRSDKAIKHFIYKKGCMKKRRLSYQAERLVKAL